LPAQAALLRVIQESEVLPVGGTRPVRVDLRVVVATNRDLEALVTREELRADLLARVSGFTLTLPPLRERREDVGLLVAALLRRHEPERSAGVSFSTDAARAILVYQWPLNVRELEQALTAACALARWGHIELRHLPPTVGAALDGARRETPVDRPLSDDDKRLCEQLESLLREHGGNVSAVAQSMGKFRSQVQRWIRRFGLVPKDFRR
jgi:transcriptional regulator with GAF, ATPase, and Fis domain